MVAVAAADTREDENTGGSSDHNDAHSCECDGYGAGFSEKAEQKILSESRNESVTKRALM